MTLFAPANILRRLERAGEITTAEASAAREDLMQLNVELFSFEPFAERIWELRHNLTSYDAWYVAVAEALGLPLATLRAVPRPPERQRNTSNYVRAVKLFTPP